jgi:hypothetical protein
VHTSNRYLDLQPVVENLARVFNLKAVTISDNPPANKWWLFRTTWILVTNNPALLASATVQSALARDPPSSRRVAVWTDDHASVSQILK